MRYTILLLLLLPAYVGSAQSVADTLAVADTLVPNGPVQPLAQKQASGKEQTKKLLLHTGMALGYAGATYFVYKKEDSHFHEESQEGKTPLKNFLANSVSPLGVGKNAFYAVGATAGLAYLTKDTRLQRTVFVWAGSLLINSTITDKMKNTFQRYRPNTGMPFNTFDGEDGPQLNHSLPSAHTSNAFTTATVFATMYKDKKWVPPVAYGLATLVGISRVYNNAHWASDVMAGAAIGFLSAKTMILSEKWFANRGIRLYPQVGRHQAGVGMTMNF